MKLKASRVIPNACVKRDTDGIKFDKWNPFQKLTASMALLLALSLFNLVNAAKRRNVLCSIGASPPVSDYQSWHVLNQQGLTPLSSENS